MQLEVVGNTKLGSVAIMDSLTINKNVRIKDSLRVQKKLLVDQDVKIKGKTVMTGNVRAKSNLTVLGNTRTKGNEVVEGNTKILGVTKMKGNAFVEGIFKFKGLADSTITGTRFLMIRPNGKVESFNKLSFASEIYSLACLATSNNQFSPIWTNSNGTISPLTHGVIYTGASNCYPTWVGIGTNSPVAEFHTQGNGYFSNNLGLGTPPLGSAKLTIEDPSLSRSGIIINLPNTTQSATAGVGIKTITFNSLRKAMTVVDGNTNKDVFRVYGSGLVEAKRLRLSLTIWSDFVFEKDYNLMSLENLEKSIEKNNHLPLVPTEGEIIKEGLDVAETDALLLQKIEELTLSVIELNKQVQELKKENSNSKIESNH